MSLTTKPKSVLAYFRLNEDFWYIGNIIDNDTDNAKNERDSPHIDRIKPLFLLLYACTTRTESSVNAIYV